MSLLVDLFGYLSIVLHGLTIVAQSMAVGGVLFLLFLARPFAAGLPDGAGLARRTAVIAGWSAAGAGGVRGADRRHAVGRADGHAGPAGGRRDRRELRRGRAGEDGGGARCWPACMFARRPAPAAPLLGLVAPSSWPRRPLPPTPSPGCRTSGVLLAASALHILGAAIWIGGIPCFVMALGRLRDGAAFRRVGARFSRMSMAGVGCILLSASAFSVLYVGSWRAVYGTAYGVMVGGQGGDVRRPAAAGPGQLPGGGAAARRPADARAADAAVRRGGGRDRLLHLLRGGLADLRAARRGPDAGPGDVARDRRAEHAADAAPGVARPRRAGAAGAAGASWTRMRR